MRFTRLLTIFSLFFLLSGPTVAADVRVAVAKDLQADARLAKERKVPILVLFSSSYCGYCTIVREEFLEPMLRNSAYNDKVIIRMVSIDSGENLRDFSGEAIGPDEFADRRGVFVTPTVKLFGPDGFEIVQDLVGLTTVDYYGGYLDAAIDESLALLRNTRKLAQNK